MRSSTTATDRARLNPQQREAAVHLDGPALVLAGPGTGKTTTLVARYRFLVRRGVDPGAIFATTFTRAAARQLKERIARNVQVGTSDLMIGTFHALCLRLLRGELGRELGIDGQINIVSEPDRFRILREVSDRSLEMEEVRDAIDRYKDRLLDPTAARRELAHAGARATDVHRAEVAAYEAYQLKLSSARLYDFGDLLMLVVAGLTSRGDLRRALSLRYRYVMVDEFQDVNPAQHELIRLLLDQHKNVWVVGDDDQAIYGWRGSDVKYILGFERAFPGTRVYKLGDNYRSRPVIVDAATRLVGHNPSRLVKPLRATKDAAQQPAIKTCVCSGEDAEAEWVAHSIQRLAEGGVDLNDIAILSRVRYLMPTLAAALIDLGIPHFTRGGPKMWTSTPAKALLGGLCVWAGRGPGWWKIPAYRESDITASLSATREAPFDAVVQALAGLIARHPPFFDQPEKQAEWEGSVRRVALESRLFDDAAGFLDHARQQAAEESSGEKEQGVCISTIHQAKGLEWRAVFLVGCRVGVMPHENVSDLEEERRLAYVAATRAKEFLAVSWPYRHSGSGEPGPSPYVGELSDGLSDELWEKSSWPEGFRLPKRVSGSQTVTHGKRAQPSIRSAAIPRSAGFSGPAPFAKGDRVRHSVHGRGVVKELKNDSCMVRFLEDGYTRDVPYRQLRPTA